MLHQILGNYMCFPTSPIALHTTRNLSLLLKLRHGTVKLQIKQCFRILGRASPSHRGGIYIYIYERDNKTYVWWKVTSIRLPIPTQVSEKLPKRHGDAATSNQLPYSASNNMECISTYLTSRVCSQSTSNETEIYCNAYVIQVSIWSYIHQNK
jgi:hypothetical protein